MAYQDILYEVDDYIGTITLNRPQSLNAFTDTLLGPVEQFQEWVEAPFDDLVRRPCGERHERCPRRRTGWGRV